MPDHKDFLDLMGRESHERGLQEVQKLKEIVATGNRAFDLKNKPEWDWLVDEINRSYESARKNLEDLRDRLTKDEVVNQDEINLIKLRMARMDQAMVAYQDVMTMVDDAIEAGDRAKSDLGEKNGVDK